jgi:Flp pilus assembly protein TadG
MASINSVRGGNQTAQNRPSRLQKHRHSRRGAAVVEMAFVLPIFLLVVFGIVEFGRAFMVEHLLANATRMGARQSIVDGSTNSNVEQAVKDFCVSSLGVTSDQVSVTFALAAGSGDAVTGNEVSTATTGNLCTVSTSVSFSNVSYLPGSYLGGRQLTGSCTMDHE